jgi:hypothetical protein
MTARTRSTTSAARDGALLAPRLTLVAGGESSRAVSGGSCMLSASSSAVSAARSISQTACPIRPTAPSHRFCCRLLHYTWGAMRVAISGHQSGNQRQSVAIRGN